MFSLFDVGFTSLMFVGSLAFVSMGECPVCYPDFQNKQSSFEAAFL